jgi:hypothetical protein
VRGESKEERKMKKKGGKGELRGKRSWKIKKKN